MKKSKMTDYKNLKQFEKSQVNGLTKHLSGLTSYAERTNDKIILRCKELGLEIVYNDSNISSEKFLFTEPRKITKEQTELGKSWLKNHFFKKNGEKRNGQATQYVDDSVLKISKSVSKFQFVGVLGVMNGMGTINQFLPIYRTYDRNGNYFDYAPIHWGQPVIFEGL